MNATAQYTGFKPLYTILRNHAAFFFWLASRFWKFLKKETKKRKRNSRIQTKEKKKRCLRERTP